MSTSLHTRLANMISRYWKHFWMRHSGMHPIGRLAMRLAAWGVPPYKGRAALAKLGRAGYIAPNATIYHTDLHLGRNVYIGDRVVIFQNPNGGAVTLGDHVCLHNDTIIEVGQGGSLTIGARSAIQPRCQISAYLGSVRIGADVQIAPGCAFYPYEHSTEPGTSINLQPLHTRGDIIIDDGVWLGYGVVILSGVHIGHGAVVGAGSVVNRNIPADAIAAGVPARVVRRRGTTGKAIDTIANREE